MKLTNKSALDVQKEEKVLSKGSLDIIPEGAIADFMSHTERKVAAGGFRGTL
jgi:hypothetical protein